MIDWLKTNWLTVAAVVGVALVLFPDLGKLVAKIKLPSLGGLLPSPAPAPLPPAPVIQPTACEELRRVQDVADTLSAGGMAPADVRKIVDPLVVKLVRVKDA